MARYRATQRGQTPDGNWHDPGDEFETDAPKGLWMELIEEDKPKPVKRGKAED
jgi:hypothetical protein